jgi:hypothetical protein
MDGLYRIGREELGPPFALHARRVAAVVAEQGLGGLFFVAREGRLLEAVYERVRPLGREPQSTYLYLSRLSTGLPAAFGLSDRQLRLGLAGRTPRSLRDVLRALGLEDDEMLQVARRAGADVDQPGAASAAALRFDRAFQRVVAERASVARDRLRRYLAQEGFFSHRAVGLIDIGWGGTIQNNLLIAFAGDAELPRVFGVYLALGSDRWQSPVPPSWKEGVVTDHRWDHSLERRAIFYFQEIFEQAARAPHGTTLGYREEGGRLVPMLKESGAGRREEVRTNPLIAELQRGILDHAADQRGRGAPSESERRAVQRGLARFVLRPSAAEVAALSALVHTDDRGDETFEPILAYWPAGHARAKRGPLGMYLYYLRERIRGPSR